MPRRNVPWIKNVDKRFAFQFFLSSFVVLRIFFFNVFGFSSSPRSPITIVDRSRWFIARNRSRYYVSPCVRVSANVDSTNDQKQHVL